MDIDKTHCMIWKCKGGKGYCFFSGRTWESSRKPAQRPCSQAPRATGGAFSKSPGNPKQLLGQTKPCKMLHPVCRIILGRDFGPELTEMRGMAVVVPCNGIFTRQLNFYRKLCKGKLLGSNVHPALPKQLYLFLDGVRPAAW